jgi:hypothetical protein
MVSAIDPTKPADSVPAVKADLRANLLAAKLEIEALQATKLQNGDPIHMQNQQLTRPQLKSFSETVTRPAVSAGELILDLSAGNVFEVTIAEDVVSMILANPPAAGLAGSCTLILKQDATGDRRLAWPHSIRWPGGVTPLVSAGGNAVDIFAFVTVDSGANWYGFRGGNDFR